jgi:hypothetical protein
MRFERAEARKAGLKRGEEGDGKKTIQIKQAKF